MVMMVTMARMSHDGERGQLGQGDAQQDLAAVGDQALDHTGEDIQQGGNTFGGDVVLRSHIPNQRGRQDDGDGVVAQRQVEQGDHGGDHILGALPGVYLADHLGDHPVDTAQVSNDTGHTTHHQGHDADLVHASHTGDHALGDTHDGQAASNQAHNAGHGDARQQQEEDVDAGEGEDQDEEVGDDLDDVILKGAGDLGVAGAHEGEQYAGDDGGDQGDQAVHLELIPHVAPGTAGGGDGGVGDHGQVVAEHGAAQNRRDGHAHIGVGSLSNRDRDGSNGGDGAHGGAHGGGHEGGDDEDAHEHKLVRHQAQAQVSGGLHAAHGAGHAGEAAGQQEDHDHDHGVRVGHALAVGVHPVLQAALFAAHQQADQQANHQRGHTGDLLKRVAAIAQSGKQDAGAQVDAQEDDQGQKGTQAVLLHLLAVIVICHK